MTYFHETVFSPVLCYFATVMRLLAEVLSGSAFCAVVICLEGDFQALWKLSLVPSLHYGSFYFFATMTQFLQPYSIAVSLQKVGINDSLPISESCSVAS